MPRTTTTLTDTAIKTAKPKKRDDGKLENNKLPDGRGLYSLVTPSGSKIWRFYYPQLLTKKRTEIKLGEYPEITLSQARAIREEYRALLAQGIDPQKHAKEQRRERERNITVKELAILWHTKRTARKAIKEETARKEFRRLELHLFPYFGEWHISEMTCKKVAQIFLDFPQSNTLYKVK